MSLTQEDLQFIQEVNTLVSAVSDEKKSKLIFDKVMTYDQQSLFRLARNLPTMEKLLKHDNFLDFWNLSFSVYLDKANDDYIDREVLQLATDIHPFDKLRGCYFYRLAMEIRADVNALYTPNELFYLTLAAGYLNLQAVFELDRYAIKLTAKSTYFPETSVILRQNNQRTVTLAANYQFLGYFLLIQALYEYYSRMDNDTAPTEREQTRQNIQNSFEYFFQCLRDKQESAGSQIDEIAILKKYNLLSDRAWRTLSNSQFTTIPKEFEPYIGEFVKGTSSLRNS